MSNLIVGADSPIQHPYDKYWDAPMTRREAHALFMKLASNDNELTGMADTAALLLNFILEKKLVNYWGYNTIGFFAPDPRYASDVPNSLREF